MRIRRPSASLLVASAALVTATAGVGLAAIPGSGGAITGCYRVSNGALRVVDAARTTTCAGGERRLTWNQQGVQGAQGIPGPKGQTGPAGPAGPYPGGNLPTGSTLRGVYGTSIYDPGNHPTYASISYGGLLAADPRPVVVPPDAMPRPTECPGSVYLPEAAPGVLCIYRAVENGFSEPLTVRLSSPGESDTAANADAAGRAGALLLFAGVGTDPVRNARGSWAVTAP